MSNSAKKFSEVAKHPATYLVLGDTGEGKTACCAALMEILHSQGVTIYMVDKPKVYPKWIKSVSFGNLDLKEPNRALFVDDAHNYLYAGEEMRNGDELKFLDILSRARRHGGKTTVIFNTQMSNAFSRRLIGMSTLIYKKPSPMQTELERPELQKYSTEAAKALDGQPINIGYMIGTGFRGLIDIELPKWYTQEISEVAENPKKRSESNKSPLGFLLHVVKTVGKVAK